VLPLLGSGEGVAPPSSDPLPFPVLGVGAGVGCGGSCCGGGVVVGLLLPGVVFGLLFPGGGVEVFRLLFLGGGGGALGSLFSGGEGGVSELSFPGVGEGLGPPKRWVNRGLTRGMEGSETDGLRIPRRSR
jgi:hypothetical protein